MKIYFEMWLQMFYDALFTVFAAYCFHVVMLIVARKKRYVTIECNKYMYFRPGEEKKYQTDVKFSPHLRDSLKVEASSVIKGMKFLIHHEFEDDMLILRLKSNDVSGKWLRDKFSLCTVYV